MRRDFLTFDDRERGGVSVGPADLAGDFRADPIAGDGNATEPRVRAYHGASAGRRPTSP